MAFSNVWPWFLMLFFTVVCSVDRRTGAPLPFPSQQGGPQIHLCHQRCSQLHSHGPEGKPSLLCPHHHHQPLRKIRLFKCAISILIVNQKIEKYTFSLLFMQFSELGFMYFSEIYLKLQLSILDLFLEKVYIYLSCTCAPRTRVFILIW